ncbi:MAG: 39S ribosomal protein L51, mitochondrial [Pycnora praestabilis]|nr:MAG: 39S ribosomal protein L51, mitochondrial [Pycnora praestabilis]
MPVQGLRTVSSSRNGVGAFILQCKRLDFHYCDWAGSSRGMNSFLKYTLPQFARTHPQIEITVSPRPRKHPVIKGTYINGREKAVCVRNLQKEQILQKAQLLRDANGEKVKKVTKPVKSTNESVRGIWSPYHGAEHTI